MLTERKPEMEKAVSSIWQLSEEDKIKEQIRRRTANEHSYQRTIDKYKNLAYEMETRANEMETRANAMETRANAMETRANTMEQAKLAAEQELAEVKKQLEILTKNNNHK